MFGNQKSVLEMSADDVNTGGGAVAYAGFWRRVFALLFDWVALTAATIVIAIPLIMLMDGTGATIAYVIGLLVQIFYWPVMESSARQATFGKVLMGIKVTDTGGQRTGFGKAFLRNLAKLLSSLIMGIGFLMAAFTSRKQALHDMVVSCVVVREGPSYFLKAVIVMVIVLVVVGGGGGYYLFGVLLPQQVGKVQETMMQHEKVSKELPKSAPSPKPAAKAQEKSAPPAAQGAPAVAGAQSDYDKLLAMPLTGINVPSSARAGPAIVHLDTQFSDSFWLKVLLPPLPDLDRGRVSVTIGQVLDAKGVDHYDRDSAFEKGSFRDVMLSETKKGEVRHFAGQRSVRVKKGTAQLDVQKVAGVLLLELPQGVIKTAAGAADLGKELAVGPLKATLKSFEGNNVSFVVAGEHKNFLGATGFDAQGVVVPRLSTARSNDLYTVGFRAPVTRIELAATSGLLNREYPFTLTRGGDAGVAAPAKAAAPEKPAVVAVTPPVPAKPAVVEVKPAPPAIPATPASAPVAAPVVLAEKPAVPRRAAPRKPAAPAAAAVEPVTAAAAPMSPAPKYNDVMTAVMNRDIAGATEALDFGIWVDREATGGLTPLMVAADYGDAAMVQLLLKYGANPNRSGSRGSVLDHARRSGNARIIDLLQKAGAR